MSQSNKKNSSEDLMASLMAELKLVDTGYDVADENKNKENLDEIETTEHGDLEGLDLESKSDELGQESDFGLLDLNFGGDDLFSRNPAPAEKTNGFEIKLAENNLPHKEPSIEVQTEIEPVIPSSEEEFNSDKTVALTSAQPLEDNYAEGDRTVAIAGYSNRSHQNQNNDIKISVGQSGAGSGRYGGWGSTDSHLAQVENLKIAQSKILDLEKENERLRQQNEELVSASEIIKERSDLLTAQVYEYKNDREALENSFKSEMALLKSQLNRKDAELQKAQMKIEELESRLKFDMKKIRVRERELENRLELIRAEKNALVRNKDEQILEARRKMDQLQLEVDSFRQKCVELNRALETNQDSFKRTTRALRLAMANLELQEENKIPLKKVD